MGATLRFIHDNSVLDPGKIPEIKTVTWWVKLILSALILNTLIKSFNLTVL